MIVPVLDIEPVTLPQFSTEHVELWNALCDLADRHPTGWVLIGGQMVLLHALQAGRAPHRLSQDLDTVIDARVRPPMLHAFMASLEELGFTPSDVSPDEIAHRFARGSTRLDVLVPEGLGPRTDRETFGRATTVEVHGGTQALQRAERLPIRVGDRTALVPRPNLLGAIIIKAAASGNDPKPRRHLLDLARARRSHT